MAFVCCRSEFKQIIAWSWSTYGMIGMVDDLLQVSKDAAEHPELLVAEVGIKDYGDQGSPGQCCGSGTGQIR